nr:hypothetical protein [Tanacetum cinerariifolium]
MHKGFTVAGSRLVLLDKVDATAEVLKNLLYVISAVRVNVNDVRVILVLLTLLFPRVGSTTLDNKVIVTLNKFKATMRETLFESFIFFSSIVVQSSGSGISNLLAVATTFTGSGNLYYQWELLTCWSSESGSYILLSSTHNSISLSLVVGLMLRDASQSYDLPVAPLSFWVTLKQNLDILVTIGLAVGPTSLPVEMTVAGGLAVGMKPLPVGTSIPPASTVDASIEEMQAHLLRLEE